MPKKLQPEQRWIEQVLSGMIIPIKLDQTAKYTTHVLIINGLPEAKKLSGQTYEELIEIDRSPFSDPVLQALDTVAEEITKVLWDDWKDGYRAFSRKMHAARTQEIDERAQNFQWARDAPVLRSRIKLKISQLLEDMYGDIKRLCLLHLRHYDETGKLPILEGENA